MEAQKSPDLPPLPELPVIRDTYCSQEMTDALVRHLQEERPDLIAELVRVETKGLIIDVHAKACESIIGYLREKSDKVHVPPTRLGMLDFLYELCRRIRKAYDLPERPLLGKPLAPGPEGPFPPMINKPVWVSKSGKPSVDQGLADEIIKSAYQKRPDIFYEYAEQMIRQIRGYEINQALGDFIKDLLPDEHKIFWPEIKSEAHSRLNNMCEITIKNTKKGK